MAFFGLFRKKDEPDAALLRDLQPLPPPLKEDFPLDYSQEPSFPQGIGSPFEQPAFATTLPKPAVDKDMQLVLSKLDAINAKLDMLARRLDSLERMSQTELQDAGKIQNMPPRRIW